MAGIGFALRKMTQQNNLLSIIQAYSLSAVDCRAHLRTPGTSFTMYTVAQVWGRKE
jgi:hypothetical protein